LLTVPAPARIIRTAADFDSTSSRTAIMHRSLRITLALTLVAAPLIGQGATQQAPADLIVTNARIYTVDESRPVVEAFAVRGGRVAFAGDARGALALKGPQTRVLDLGGRTVIPGMVDAHGHVSGLGSALAIVDLTGASSYDEIIARVAAKAKTVAPGVWVTGRGWDQNRWADTRFPSHEKLSAAVPNNPVLLERVDGHANLANKKAMEAAGVTASTKDPVGGRIEHLADGSPSGVFVDNAQPMTERVVPATSHDELKRQVMNAIAEAQRWGLTGVHDAGESQEVLDIYEELGKAGQINSRIYAMIGDDSAAIARAMARGPQSALYGGTLWIRSIKLYADGAMGSRGAAMLEPYADDPANIGLLKSTQAHLQAVSIAALRSGFQVCTHAIGDRGNRVALDAYQAALAAVPVADHRFRIEHAQNLHYADIPRFAQLGVIPSMQPSHQSSDMYWVGTRLGASRLVEAYPWRSLLNTGIVIPGGSDFPVERVNPLISFHAAVSRQDANNYPPGGWQPEQRMTREEALKSMTIWPAFAAFQEHELGSLTAGKYADFTVLDQDIMRAPVETILNTHVVSTWVGGKMVYEAK
jgi:predicted amidohydrolase YtcJ